MLSVLSRGVGSVRPSAVSIGVRSLSDVALEKTALHDLHVELEGKMVPFAGYSLPVQYKSAGVLQSHLHTRSDDCASLFDVGHMGQIRWHGKDAVEFLETVLVGDVAGLKVGQAMLSLIPNEAGGLLDDTVVSNLGDYVSMVVNGATKHEDMAHFVPLLAAFKASGKDVDMEYLHTRNLVALQGPGAAQTLSKFVDLDLPSMGFMEATFTKFGGSDVLVTRCGYTGEDGFEISMASDDAEGVAKSLLDSEGVLPAGLGARDSLRLEAGLCLYGNDIDETTTPIEAALAWTIPKVRRTGDRANFVGADVILSQLKDKSWTRRRVGLGIDGAPARAGATILSADGETEIGSVTSGTMSPSLKRPIAMGYVAKGHHKKNTEVLVKIRNKTFPAKLEPMPFVPARYYQKP